MNLFDLYYKETLGNIGNQKRKLNTSKIIDLTPVEYRNF
jgi:pyruvate formate lyase activating enzyme